MADIAAPVATSTPAAPAATTTTTPAPTKPAIDLGLGTAPAPAAETPKAPEESAVKRIAKAQAAERKAQAQLKELQAKLETTSTATTEAQKAAEAMAEIRKNPKKFTELTGISLETILNAIAAPDEPVDPAHQKTQAELKALQDRIDAREKADKEAKEAAEKATRERDIQGAIKTTTSLIESEGKVLDADGYERWAIVSQDPTAARTAIDAVMDHVEKHQLDISREEGLDMLRSALDQMERHDRKRVAHLLAAAKTKSTDKATSDRSSELQSKLRPEIMDRFSQDGTRGIAPPPAGMRQDGPVTKSRF